MKTLIRIQSSHLLNERFKLNDEGLDEKVDKLRTLWMEKEEIVLEGLEKITGLTFARNCIDVFMVNPDNAPSISFPLILVARDSDKRNACVLIHELIHNLMWDNDQKDNWSRKIQNLYPMENKKVAIHVAVHAILEAVYVKILNKPEAIAIDIENSQGKPDYKRAWEIVKEEGFENIIKKLKSS